MTVLTD